MFNSERFSDERPTLFCLHYLGGSSREWERVAQRLDAAHCVGIDLPGFGEAAQTPGYTVADMATFVARIVRAAAPRRWMLAGHSMGAKVAAVLAQRSEDGEEGLAGLEGLVMLAGSPPCPEPMDDAQRRTMIGWFSGDPQTSRAEAQQYIAANSNALEPPLAGAAVADVLRASPAAWRAWLENGSREDWSQRIGILQTPALLLAGADDEQLGPSAQHALMAPHFARARSETLAGVKHLLPLERPDDVARLIQAHIGSIALERERRDATDAAYRGLIASDRVGSNTRKALLERGARDDAAYEPVALDANALAVLRALVARVVPQSGFAPIDLAARIDKQLAAGVGDGWRFAELPPDAQAYRAGLLTLTEEAERAYGHAFEKLDGTRQDELLERVAAGDLDGSVASAEPRLNAAEMRLWFEDVRGDAVKLYVAHPETLARIGYSGIAYGGDGEPKPGFVRVGIGEREPWEPIAQADVTS